MVDRPIIFSGPMVRALLDGRKTQTRRLAWGKPRIAIGPLGFGAEAVPQPSPWQRAQPGDRLFVREQFSFEHAFQGVKPRQVEPHASAVWYWADGNPEHGDWIRPKPGMHMPRWASRLTLTVTDVRVQRLQEINADDAEAEGLWRGRARRNLFWLNVTACRLFEGQSHKAVFRDLWNSLHGEAPARWEDNPEVVALSFTVEQRNIDR